MGSVITRTWKCFPKLLSLITVVDCIYSYGNASCNCTCKQGNTLILCIKHLKGSFKITNIKISRAVVAWLCVLRLLFLLVTLESKEWARTFWIRQWWCLLKNMDQILYFGVTSQEHPPLFAFCCQSEISVFCVTVCISICGCC